MTDPETTIYNKLAEITNATVYQNRPEVIVEDDLSMITYNVGYNVPEYDLGKDIGADHIRISVDIWAKTSGETADLLSEVETKMRSLNYLLTFNQHVADPSGFSHRITQFTY